MIGLHKPMALPHFELNRPTQFFFSENLIICYLLYTRKFTPDFQITNLNSKILNSVHL